MLTRIVQAAKGAMLTDVFGAVGLSMKYMMKPKATMKKKLRMNHR